MLPPLPGIKSLSPEKEVFRLKLKAERKAARADRPDAAIHAARNFVGRIPLDGAPVVALYHPLGDELDTEPLFDALSERDIKIALPITPKRKGPLDFRRFHQGDPLAKGKYGILEPSGDAQAVVPDIVVTPLLGFTVKGERLGYGGGYYDRTLAELRETRTILAVGYAYGAQEVDALPTSRLDQHLDWVVTERGAIPCR